MSCFGARLWCFCNTKSANENRGAKFDTKELSRCDTLEDAQSAFAAFEFV